MPWWGDVLFLIVAGIAVWGFISLVGFRTQTLTRKTWRTAENLYPEYADSTRRQRRYAREHGGEWREGDSAGNEPPPQPSSPPPPADGTET
ncbi:MAG TPA: hypothetical protein VGM14_23930 [Streptosporangiaceae bacterium]